MTAERTIRQSQGSIWRRWDPHVHLPGTLFNDQFGDLSVAAALEALADAQPAIEAIGVTDYFTTECYRRAADALESGVAPTIQFAFPNVELRLDIATSSNKSVNIHLLCRPEEVDRLDALIGGLEFSWAEGLYRADRAGLIQLGRDFRRDAELGEVDALRAGAAQFKVSFETLRKQLQADGWARENVLVAVAGGQHDGTSGLRDVAGGFAARRQSIEALASVIFSGNPNQAQFWSGDGVLSEQEIERVYGGLKLCLHGSDAHDASRLGVPDNDRFSWLNGDPTFDTLKLARLSPKTRAHIGPEPPNAASRHGRIISLHVPNSKWFVNETVDLNPGLVAIIGARGSGKTALADLIAAGAGSTEPFQNESSFVRRAGRLIRDSLAEIKWSHDEITTCDFAEHQISEATFRPVRYLSQQFVERLCASDGVSDDLLSEIERVIFEAWPLDQRQGATSFRELLEIRLTSIAERRSAELDAVLDLSDRISEARQRSRMLHSRRDELKEQEKQRTKLDDEITSLTKNADIESAKRLRVVSTALRKHQEEVHRRRTSLNGLLSAVQSARSTSFPRYRERIREEHDAAGLADAEWTAFEIEFVGDVDGILSQSLKRAGDGIVTLTGAPIDQPESVNLDGLQEDELRERSINELQAEADRLERLAGLDLKRSKELKRLTNLASKARTRIEKLKRDIERTENERVDELVARRISHYGAYFRALLEEESELRQLYAPLDDVLQRCGASVAKLRFVVKRTVDVDSWAAEGESLLDLRKEGPFRGEGELARVAQEELVAAWEAGDAQEAAAAIGEFSARYSDDLRKGRLVRGEDDEALGEWVRAVSRWLYRTDHIRLRYSLEYDGLSIERLSPGTRGIVLLLLYLAVDQEESDPLIIDQPEENLDPESVYTELVQLFRTASQRRQIIMVTHNANLVVNTDVDQVIVAHCGSLEEGRLPELEYVGGGLEDPETRRWVCEVLEGGAEAFRQRARRLGLDLSVPEAIKES